ncbi:MAG: ribosome maturation factor RimP [Actinobacteria bacterium HGW-Actinobacteria-2]|nr:MAG: ribosome maturation factor RimP [Actinobacteria bacterium HGW-Actinobacteria-2]
MNSADISALLTPVVTAHDLEIDRVEVTAAGKRSVVRVFLDGDGPAGKGPSLDQIAAATRSISAALDDDDPTGGRPYTLEVSSRGVGRPLTDGKHFRRNSGRLVVVSTADGEVTGRIVEADDAQVTIDVDGQPQTIALAAIDKALVKVELNRPLTDASDDEDEEL